MQEILRWQRAQAHIRASSNQTFRGGASCFPQRSGGSLNLNVHYHVVVPDGVFVREQERDAATVSFLQLPRPTAPTSTSSRCLSNSASSAG